MDDIRTFMAGRKAPFRLEGLRAIFVTPEDELDEEDKVCVFRRVCGCSRACRFAILFPLSSMVLLQNRYDELAPLHAVDSEFDIGYVFFLV